ncbi:hypothetical protein ACFX2C_044102 [Malus domestica]
MSHFGRSGPPDIRETYSLLVLNITFRTTADDLFPLFDKYGKVVDVFIPRDRRTGDSRGFAFVRYKYQDEAQKAVEKLDGRVVDGREIMVQFAKYGPNAERIHKGRVSESTSKLKSRSRSRSRSPRPRYRDEYKEKDYGSRSRSREKYSRDRHHRSEREHRYRSRSRSASPDNRKRGRYDDERRSRSRSYGSASPVRNSPKSRRSPSPRRSSSPRRSPSPRMSASPRRSASPQRSPSPRTTPSRGENVDGRNRKERSPTPKDISPHGRRNDSPSLSPRKSDADVKHFFVGLSEFFNSSKSDGSLLYSITGLSGLILLSYLQWSIDWAYVVVSGRVNLLIDEML